MENKVVTQYERADMGVRCHVHLLRLYLSKLPSIAFERDIFYWKPRKEVPLTPDEPWFTANVLDHNSLDRCLKTMFADAGIDSTNKSNHSLRATAISRMMDKQIPSKVIMERSGHLSKDGLLPYERTTSIQQQLSSKALSDVTLLKGNQESECKDLIKKESQTRGDVGEENRTILKGMNFHDMEGCTINISFHTK